jgi:hypothetical protein
MLNGLSDKKLLSNNLFNIADALMLVELSIALWHLTVNGKLPLHIECKRQCRPSIASKCIEVHPEAVDGQAFSARCIESR